MDYIPAKTIIQRNKNPEYWFGHDYNMNIYKGCCHGCIYCDSRSDCYGIEDFDRVRAKKDATSIIEKELRTKQKWGVVGTGAMSDPYNPFEKEHRLTRQALKHIDHYGFGLGLATKSSLLKRDMDIIKSINGHSPVCIKMTITTVDDQLSRKIEPYVDASSKRFETLRILADAGIFTGILLMPILPFINDTWDNIEGIVKRASEAGVKFIYPGLGVTLRQNQRYYYYEQLDTAFPGVKQLYMQHFRDDYRCHSLHAKELGEQFRASCKEHGLYYKMSDIIKNYRLQAGQEQLTLFD
ncbi:radical SAM protein [Vallitalea pronyensis]|uniref:Radical SAM protein n=1 Tax=Vallitalea pronyensis TaxID=1348613 RepID=A0A8J8MKD8_9FIRM|nr:radical SAM protein [Vallitalea pronyensis]QUI23121.1 radical SAM protein [Vallitalea pronyensis]